MLEALAAELAELAGRARSDRIAAYARSVGAPKDRIYRQLRAAGWSSGRRRRTDAGQTKVPEAALDRLAAALQAGLRKTGQATLTIPVVRQSLEASSVSFEGASDSRLAALLRDRGMDLRTQRRGRQTHVRMRSGHPNHVHQVDASACLIYYSPRSQQQRDLSHELGAEPYKNKQARIRIWRYIVTDHYSGCLRVYYFEQAGEDEAACWESLCRTWDRESPWHGLPNIVVLDKGCAGPRILRALAALGIEARVHTPGNARAKGAVEQRMRLVEQQFEARLRLQPASSFADLDAAAGAWCERFNADQIAGIDCRLHRRNARLVRLEAWQRIRPEQLVELPEDGRDLAVYEAAERRVAGDLTITYRHPRLRRSASYLVARIPGVEVGSTVTVQPRLVDADGAVLVRHEHGGETHEERLLPIGESEDGFLDTDVAWGEYRSLPFTEAERTGQRLRELAGPLKPGAPALGGSVRALDAIEAGGERKVIPMPRRGAEVEPRRPAGELLGLADAGRYARRRLGEAWDPALFERLAEKWPRGASTGELDAWLAELGREAETG